MSHEDSLGNRMKGYELAAEGERLDVRLPVYVRIDGRSFSKFTRGLERPFDVRISRAMIETTKGLVERTHARLGYTQSDEISLVYLADGERSDILFNGRKQKLTSVLAALATALFTAAIPDEWRTRLPHFDCRVCGLPSQTEAANMFLWRWKDATKNAIQMVAQANFSANQLHGKHGSQMVAMLKEKGIDFNDFPAFFRRGTFAQRVLEERLLTDEEQAQIPEAHRPKGPVNRHRIDTFEVEDFYGMANREEFVFSQPLDAIRKST